MSRVHYLPYLGSSRFVFSFSPPYQLIDFSLSIAFFAFSGSSSTMGSCLDCFFNSNIVANLFLLLTQPLHHLIILDHLIVTLCIHIFPCRPKPFFSLATRQILFNFQNMVFLSWCYPYFPSSPQAFNKILKIFFVCSQKLPHNHHLPLDSGLHAIGVHPTI